jgi:tetratricopeptide (TPR) repeat protein
VPQQQLLDDLVEDLTKGTALIVAGTGVSILATGDQPCARWDGLIRNGIEYCVQTNLLHPDEAASLRGLLKKKGVSKLLDVAERVSQTLGAPEGGEFRRWLRSSVGSLELRYREIIDAIHEIGTLIATTNYDDLLTRHRGIEPVPWTRSPAALEVIRGDRHGVLHLHGYYDDPPSVVLGVRSYQKLLEGGRVQAIQQAVAASRTLLFIGCGDGLSDPNFGALLKWTASFFGDSIYRHYCLCRASELKALQKRYPPSERLFYLAYGKNFDDLVPFLRNTLASVVRSRRPGFFAVLPGPGYCIGREREVEAVVTALLEEHTRPLPLLGGPGMGKTTIALNAVHDKRVATRFGVRRWFVRCDGVKSRTELRAAIAAALGLPITPTVEQAMIAALAIAPGVLVIDNAETPLDADPSAVELLALLVTIESLAVVITVRGHERPRGVSWRASLEAERLDETSARDVFLAVSGKTKFAEDVYLDGLLRDLDGVAIAITLLARYAEVFDSLEPVWAVWNAKRTAMLRDGRTPSRETDIAVSYEMSIGVLSPAAYRLLTILAMLPNGIAFMDVGNVFHDFEGPSRELRARALVFDDARRLRMLAPLREYVAATHRPTPSDAEPAFDHYLLLAAGEGPKVGEAGGAEATARLAPEAANVERMFARSVATRQTASVAVAAVGWTNLMRFTGLGSISLIADLAKSMLEAGMTKDAAKCVDRLGDVALAHADHKTARQRYETALPLFREVGYLPGEAKCIRRFGDIALRDSDYKTASKHYQTALRLYRRTSLVTGEAKCIEGLGHVALQRSDHKTARTRYQAALRLYKKGSSLGGEAKCIQGLGDIALQRSDYKTARKRYEAALPLYRTIGDPWGEADCIMSIGDIELTMGARDEAKARYLKALALYESFPQPYWIGMAHSRLARLASSEEAQRAHVSMARSAWRSIGRDDAIAKLDTEFGAS